MRTLAILDTLSKYRDLAILDTLSKYSDLEAYAPIESLGEKRGL